MTVGTKSLLFGVHQFAWHPWTVACSWTMLYKRAPYWWEAVAIFFHDTGYWGCEQMDDENGELHPAVGAARAARWVKRLHAWSCCLRSPLRAWLDEEYKLRSFFEGVRLGSRASALALGHSRSYCRRTGCALSALSHADKLCTRFDAPWFYLLRATLSGEIKEYVKRSPLPEGTTNRQWQQFYYASVEKKFG